MRRTIFIQIVNVTRSSLVIVGVTLTNPETYSASNCSRESRLYITFYFQID